MKAIDSIKTKRGWFYVEADEKAVRRAGFSPRKCREGKPSKVLKQAMKEMHEYVDGKRKTFSVPIEPDIGTEFQKDVWKELKRIPFGRHISYGQLAKNIGRPKSARAVGNAAGKNPVIVMIPCHRLFAEGNRIGGFTGGLDKKRYLLGIENQDWM